MTPLRLGYAMCGSFCTLRDSLKQLQILKDLGYDITPIMSEITYSMDTRFGTAEYFRNEVTAICGKPIMKSIVECEPIGPKKLLDILLIAPCTGNTLGKMANGITDTSVTMAAKAHLRNGRPLVLALATNDALTASAPNIGALLNRRNIYFVPFGQDDATGKPSSCIANFDKIPETIRQAEQGLQIQSIIFS